ncbi:NUDIX domain-containing protein [Paenibacillus beijingensis]|uniref:NUDIX hydrolase n=1 Tax=Paenibacillus beijingensis TaxID=1126833 RepID=A0A0D5NLJ8_9BACL|nr:NUDIX domain-containing protein [Paenibacillus beijingensis]AJY75882.1 NUDIX hydrolase [Paenibacillus beijingensis]
MKKHRIRPTALIFREDQILLIEYEENGEFHYNLPGGGLKKGELLMDGLSREVYEEACIHIETGSIAFVYEFNPNKQSGDYDPETKPSIHIIFECTLNAEEEPKLPAKPDPNQTAVRWMPLSKLKTIVLYPNIADHILDYYSNRRSIELLEDYKLASYGTLTDPSASF